MAKSGVKKSPGGVAANVSHAGEKTAAWPGPPGKTQKRDRSGGTKKIRQAVKIAGL
jgi:hypothetical protein